MTTSQETTQTIAQADIDFLLSSNLNYAGIIRLLSPHKGINWKKVRPLECKDAGFVHVLDQVGSFRDLRLSQYTMLRRLETLSFPTFSGITTSTTPDSFHAAISRVLLNTEKEVKQCQADFEKCLVKIFSNQNTRYVPKNLAPLLDDWFLKTENESDYVFSKSVLVSWEKNSQTKPNVQKLLQKRKDIETVNNISYTWKRYLKEKDTFSVKDVTPSLALKDYTPEIAKRLFENMFTENSEYVVLYALRAPKKLKDNQNIFSLSSSDVFRALKEHPVLVLENRQEVLDSMSQENRSELLTTLTLDLAFRRNHSPVPAGPQWSNAGPLITQDASCFMIDTLLRRKTAPSPTPLVIRFNEARWREGSNHQKSPSQYLALLAEQDVKWCDLKKDVVPSTGKKTTIFEYLKSLKEKGGIHPNTEGLLALAFESQDKQHPFEFKNIPILKITKDDYRIRYASIKKMKELSQVSYQKELLGKAATKKAKKHLGPATEKQRRKL